MKVLFLDHPQFTSCTRFLWQGINEILGPENVIAFPAFPILYDQDTIDLLNYDWYRDLSSDVANKPLPYGIPPFSPGEGLTGGNESIVHRYHFTPKFHNSHPNYTEDDIVRMLRAGLFSFVVLGNSHRIPTLFLSRLKAQVPNFPPIIYLDAGERDELNEHWIHVYRPQVVFKQILTPAIMQKGLHTKIPGYTLKMYPLPLCATTVDHPSMRIGCFDFGHLRQNDTPPQKLIDMFYGLGDTWPKRAEVTQTIDNIRHQKDLNYIRRTINTAENEDYHLVLSRCRFVVSMRGSGRDTIRYWDIPLYETLLVADGTMGCIHPYPFEDYKTARFYTNMDELTNIINYFAEGHGEEQREKIAKAGKQHLWQYHSSAARAIFFLDRIQEETGCLPEAFLRKIHDAKIYRQWDGRDWRGPVSGCE